MSHRSKMEYLRSIQGRYLGASRSVKQLMLDEFCAVTQYHRKYALTLLHRPVPGPKARRRRRSPRYGAPVIAALKAIWEAAGYPWSLRLKTVLKDWLPWARRHLGLTRAQEAQLLAISPRQMDRRLKPYKLRQKRSLYGRTKPGRLLKHHIPLRTDRWQVSVPGFTELDLVAHGGDSAQGEFVHSLNLTDIHTTWVETGAVLGKSQVRVREALEQIRRSLPFSLQGIDSDNGSEFINDHLYRYCQLHHIQFTRGRPYKKDDNAHIEQKNWTHVRKLLGYVRYDSELARRAIHELYRHELRLFQNFFLPSVKLMSKERVGSRVRRHYDRPQTPLERVLACPEVPGKAKARLRLLKQRLDPFALSRSIDRKLQQIYSLANPHPPRGEAMKRSQQIRVLPRKQQPRWADCWVRS